MAEEAGSDEALARALQMQYDQEQQQLRSQSQRQPPSTTNLTSNTAAASAATSLRSNRASQNNQRTVDPNASRSEQRKQRKQQQRERRIPPTITGTPISASTEYQSAPEPTAQQNVSDEELARRLAAEEEAAAMSEAISASRSSYRGPEQAPPDYARSSTATSTSNPTFQDELTSQEWRDAQMAQQLQEHEERKAAREHARLESIVAEGERNRMAIENANGYHQGPRHRLLNNKKRVYGCLAGSILLFVGSIVGLIVYFVVLDGSSSGLVVGVTDSITDEDEAKNDPFTNQTTLRPWPNQGEGLRITIYNALQTKWYQYFYDAIADWNSGYPRALEIDSEVLDYDYNCEKINNAIKVCNGDYNKTGWRGINELTYVNGLITSSRARMNDFYLINNKPDDDADRAQYVMCHELGHGFGLLHTDEDFGNQDTWNCMDYTRNYGGNMSLPGEVNHIILYDLYGLVPGSPAYPPEGGTRKRLRKLTGRNKGAKAALKAEPHPEWLLKEIDQVYNSTTGQRLELDRWKTIHKNGFSEAHEIKLAEGHTFQVRKLLA